MPLAAKTVKPTLACRSPFFHASPESGPLSLSRLRPRFIKNHRSGRPRLTPPVSSTPACQGASGAAEIVRCVDPSTLLTELDPKRVMRARNLRGGVSKRHGWGRRSAARGEGQLAAVNGYASRGELTANQLADNDRRTGQSAHRETRSSPKKDLAVSACSCVLSVEVFLIPLPCQPQGSLSRTA